MGVPWHHIPQLFIAFFLAMMVGGAIWLKIPLSLIVNDALVRLAMNGVLVLSLMPMLNAGIGINFGLLLFFACGCLLVHLFFRCTAGKAMRAVGENEEYARLCGIDVDRMRQLATIPSTVIGAVGICVYAQSCGFIELYDAPMMMAFPAASALLIGGSITGRTTVINVIIGTFLFHTIYILSGPLANDLLVPEMTGIFRLMLTNGVILFAMLHAGGRNGEPRKAI